MDACLAALTSGVLPARDKAVLAQARQRATFKFVGVSFVDVWYWLLGGCLPSWRKSTVQHASDECMHAGTGTQGGVSCCAALLYQSLCRAAFQTCRRHPCRSCHPLVSQPSNDQPALNRVVSYRARRSSSCTACAASSPIWAGSFPTGCCPRRPGRTCRRRCGPRWRGWRPILSSWCVCSVFHCCLPVARGGVSMGCWRCRPLWQGWRPTRSSQCAGGRSAVYCRVPCFVLCALFFVATYGSVDA